MLIELRATGGQTVVAPSTHPDGDQYLWHQFGEPARINADALKQIVQKIAICSLIARYWTSEGNRHDLGLPIAGLFVSCEWLEEDAVQLIELAAEAAGHQNPRDRVATVRSTYEKFHNDQHITGIPTLLKYWPQEVVNPLTKWCEGLGLNGTDHSAWTQSRTHNANGAAPKSEEQQEHAEKSQASQEQGSSSNGEVLAREVLKNFLEAAKVDPTAAIQKLLADAQQVAALAFLANRDRGVVEAAYIELRTAGARARDVEALKRAITAERRKQRKFRVVDRDETPELTTVRSVLPDAPVPEDLLIPQNYRVSEDGVSAERAKVGPDGEPSVSVTKVAPAPILIAGRLKDVQDGTESVRLVWKRDNGWRSHTAGRVVVATARQIVELAGQGLPTTSNDAPELVRYLSEFEATNMNLLPRAQVSRQMGWQRSGDK